MFLSAYMYLPYREIQILYLVICKVVLVSTNSKKRSV